MDENLLTSNHTKQHTTLDTNIYNPITTAYTHTKVVYTLILCIMLENIDFITNYYCYYISVYFIIPKLVCNNPLEWKFMIVSGKI
jgi:hypothetical protein